MDGRFPVIPGKDRMIENFGYYQTKLTSSKLFYTQTSIQRVSLLFVTPANYYSAYVYASHFSFGIRILRAI